MFAALTGGSTSGLDASELRISNGGNAADGNDFINDDSTTGNLYYDADGNGAGGRMLFATLVGLTGTLDSSDFALTLPPAASGERKVEHGLPGLRDQAGNGED